MRTLITPLHRSCSKGSAERVTALLKAGADPEIRSPSGFTALHFAAIRGRTSVVNLLLQAGVEIDPKNIKGNTPLHCAAEKGSRSVAASLIRAGANVDSRGTHGETPLHLAARRGRGEVVQLLIDEGAIVDAADDKGWTPQDCAELGGHAALAEWIRGRPRPAGGPSAIGKGTGQCSANTEWDVFLSYHSSQSMLVRQVADQLISIGCKVWFAEYETFDWRQRRDEDWVNAI